ncbi:hypothetical protein GTW69_40610 [Streptomyces sp. SID7760]|nr:hypothetical protein [Streptomyces sp. SID7760]
MVEQAQEDDHGACLVGADQFQARLARGVEERVQQVQGLVHTRTTADGRAGHPLIDPEGDPATCSRAGPTGGKESHRQKALAEALAGSQMSGWA